MNEFKNYHPLVNFIYFTLIISFSMFFMNPVCLVISLVCSFIYSIRLNGRKALKFNFMYMLPLLLISAFINPAFNHEGITILSYLPNGNPLTLESIAYGLAAATMIVTVICWFSCYNFVMTSDKFIYLFGKIIPAMSLILSMVLRFVPKFKTQIKAVSMAQKCIGRDSFGGSIIKRAKCGITILSIMVSWTLENAIETADSMKSRGYGLKNRTAFSVFKFTKRDTVALICICLLGIYVLTGYFFNAISFHYFPYMTKIHPALYRISIFVTYIILCLVPVIIDITEERKWKV